MNLNVFLWSHTWHFLYLLKKVNNSTSLDIVIYDKWFIVSTCQNLTSSLPIPRQGNVWANASLYMGCEAANTRGFMELVVLTKVL